MHNNVSADYGPNLARYIDQRRGDLSMRKFAELHGLDHTIISSWGSGRRPSLTHLRPVSEALGITVAEVLVVMGVGKPEDFVVNIGGSVERAIAEDPSLADDDERELLRELLVMSPTSAGERQMLRELLGMFVQLRAGNDSATVRGSTNPRKRPKRT